MILADPRLAILGGLKEGLVSEKEKLKKAKLLGKKNVIKTRG